MSKPEILLAGAYPEWDMADLVEKYVVHKLYEAADRDAFIRDVGADIRAIATRGELQASAQLMASTRAGLGLWRRYRCCKPCPCARHRNSCHEYARRAFG